MKFGVQLHPELGADAVIEEAREADRLGYDSVWLYDHLMNWAGVQTPEFPLETLTLAAAIGAATTRTRLSWAMLNLTFYNPAWLAKALATIDQITHGRVIAAVGSGWFKEECQAYNIPMLEDHDERSAAAYEAVKLIKQLWAHPAPEATTFEGTYFHTNNLPFQPAPYQAGGPPIWYGGESDATMKLVRELADGWVLLGSTGEAVKRVLSQPDWPDRPMVIAKGARIIVGEDQAAAMEAARRTYGIRRKIREAQIEQPGHPLAPIIEFEEFVQREIIGPPDECVSRVSELESYGINYIRLGFDDPTQMEAFARLVLPRFMESHSEARSSGQLAHVR